MVAGGVGGGKDNHQQAVKQSSSGEPTSVPTDREGSPSARHGSAGSTVLVPPSKREASKSQEASQSGRQLPEDEASDRRERPESAVRDRGSGHVAQAGRGQRHADPVPETHESGHRLKEELPETRELAVPEDDAGQLQEALLEESAGQMSISDRAAMVTFFDGSTAADLMLEGASVLRLPDFYVPYLLNGYPHGFQGLSQEDGMKLLDVTAGLARDEEIRVGALPNPERSVEVRQALVVDPRGRRRMRKSLWVNGEEVCLEESTL